MIILHFNRKEGFVMCIFAEYIINENKSYRKRLEDAKTITWLAVAVTGYTVYENYKLKKKLKERENK